MQKVSSEDIFGEDRSDREANELVCDLWEGLRVLLSKRDTRRATAIVVSIECYWRSPKGKYSA